jgi:hypothetical protein
MLRIRGPECWSQRGASRGEWHEEPTGSRRYRTERCLCLIQNSFSDIKTLGTKGWREHIAKEAALPLTNVLLLRSHLIGIPP